MTNFKSILLAVSKGILGFFGIISLIFLALSFTDIPFNAYYKLGMVHSNTTEIPNIIVVLGGTGMPSQNGLIKTFYASAAAKKYKKADIIIAMPYSGSDSLYPLQLMANELIVKGIDSLRIKFEPLGFNTRSQAVNIASMLNDGKQLSLLIITTPEHMYRSIHAFKKVGFTKIAGLPAFEKPIEEEKLIDSKGDEKIGLSLRYNIWSYLNYELLVLREYCAIAYYKINGWI
ncbi:MAG: ElyC/SanA/YdcF family protein [Salinivirgaceae bacterium]|jgi:uncharacterized SAM-binding protein YcdF (DUF218 family)